MTTGAPAEASGCWLDEQGRLFLATDRGLGIVHTLDMLDAANAIEAGVWAPQPAQFADLPQRFGAARSRRPAGSRA